MKDEMVLVAISQPRRQTEREGKPQPTCWTHLGIRIPRDLSLHQPVIWNAGMSYRNETENETDSRCTV